jgi:hypothetical protein
MATVRVLLIVGAVGGLTAWAVAQGAAVPAGVRAGTSSVRAQAPRGTADATAAVTAVEPGFEVAFDRLRTGLGVMPAPTETGRNPFRFGADGSVRRTSAAQHRATLVQAESTDPGLVAPDRPPMQLLGVASEEGDAAPVRTAVIGTPRQLYLVREGEQMALRFLVLRIGTDAVELRDLATDDTFQLALR